MTHAIETRKLTRAFGAFTAVREVDLAVPEGTVFGYLGLNGAGKSTTIRMLTTLLEPTSGSARVAGHDVAADPLAVRRVVGLVGDEDGALARASWTALEYLGYFARLHGLPSPAAAADGALDRVGLDVAWRRRPVRAYSTGMRRRLELARALLGAPRVLFLDEPTRGLDLPAKREVWDVLRALVAEEGVTVFLSSHETAEIEALCERLAVVSRGRLAYQGSASDLSRAAGGFEEALVRLLRPTSAREAAPPTSKPSRPRGV